MYLRFSLLLLCLVGFPLRAEPPAILVLGDSLSAGYGIEAESGWVSLLERQLKKQSYAYRVINASISGETTSGGRSRLPQALERHQPAVVIIELGGNDGLRGLPLSVIRQNLAAMIETARSGGSRVLLVGMRLPPNYGNSYTRGFERLYQTLAEQYGLPLVPFLLEGVAGNGNLMQADGIHAGAAAQQRLLQNVWPHLQPLLSGSQHDTEAPPFRQTRQAIPKVTLIPSTMY